MPQKSKASCHTKIDFEIMGNFLYRLILQSILGTHAVT